MQWDLSDLWSSAFVSSCTHEELEINCPVSIYHSLQDSRVKARAVGRFRELWDVDLGGGGVPPSVHSLGLNGARGLMEKAPMPSSPHCG